MTTLQNERLSERLATMMTNSPSGMAVYAGNTGNCLFADEKMATIIDGSVEALRRENFRTLSSWQETGLAEAAESTLGDGLPRYHKQILRISSDKSVSLDCFLSRFAIEGKPHLLLIVSDVTAHKKAEQAISVREKELRTLIATIPDLIVRYDRELRRTYVNPAWEQASGLSAREVVNVPAAAIPKVPTPAHAGYMQKIRQVLETGESQSIGFPWVNAHGAELYLEYVIVPEHDRNGAITGVLAVGRDVTEHKRAEEALAAREREFRTLAENSPDNIARYDADCRTIYVNSTLEKTLGRPASELLGARPMERPIIDAVREYQERIAEVLATGNEAELDIVMPDKGEGTRQHNIRFVAERGADGAIHGVLAVGRDVTERRAAEAELLLLTDELEQRVRERTAELERSNAELERMNRMFVGRELKMIELKEKIKELKRRVASSPETGAEA